MKKKSFRASLWGAVLLFVLLFIASVVFRDPKSGEKLDQSNKELTELPPVERWYTKEDVELGDSLYYKSCSECHGARGIGTGDWRKRLKNGTYPPPPLNGSAHTWHHSMKVLLSTIDKGGKPVGGTMPAFGDKLTLKERRAILAYIQSLWTDEIYLTWSRDLNKD